MLSSSLLVRIVINSRTICFILFFVVVGVAVFCLFVLVSRLSTSLESTPQKFENGVFTLEKHQIFSIHTAPEISGNATI